MWPFRRKSASDLANLAECIETDPAKIYVNLIFLEMFNQQSGFIIAETEGLRRLPHYALEELPPVARIINRLKVMANLDPVIYPESRDGKIEMAINGTFVLVHARFDDHAPNERVKLNMEDLPK